VYDALLRLLQASPVTRAPRITDLKTYGWNAFRVKIQAIVTPTLTFQVWLNHNPHHSHLKTNFPHHFHDKQGRVVSSVLQGDPLQDLPVVLAEVERFLSTRPGM
jgi:hypothetical protein